MARPRVKEIKEWEKKYIDLLSDLDNTMDDAQIAEACGISRQWLYLTRKNRPDIQKIILENLRTQLDRVGEKALKLLYKKMEKSDKLLLVGLELGQIWKPGHEVTNRYEVMEKPELLRDIKLKLSGAIAKQLEVNVSRDVIETPAIETKPEELAVKGEQIN